MASYKFTEKAIQDLKHIWNYTLDNWSETQADQYYNELIRHCSMCAANPTIGRSYEKLITGLRGSKINNSSFDTCSNNLLFFCLDAKEPKNQGCECLTNCE